MDLRKSINIEDLENTVVNAWLSRIHAEIEATNDAYFVVSKFKVNNKTIITWGLSLLFYESIEEADETIDEISVSIVIQTQNDDLQVSCDVALGAKLLYCSSDETVYTEQINREYLSVFLSSNKDKVLESLIKGIKAMQTKRIDNL